MRRAVIWMKRASGAALAVVGVLALGMWAAGCSKATQYRSGCEAGEPLKCYYLGDLYAKGLEVPLDHAQAAIYIEQACEGGVIWACPRIGEMYEQGQGVTRDVAKAKKFYLQACDKPDDEGCKLAFALVSHTCQEGDLAGCDDLAWFYDDGVGTAQDKLRSGELARKTCSQGSTTGCGRLQAQCEANGVEACTHLAELSETGAGLPKDRQIASAYYTRACDRKHLPACEGVQRMLGTACKQGEVAACMEVGEMHLVGPEALRSEDKALMFFQDACRAGGTRGCERVATTYEKRCEAGDRDLCVQLADMYARGIDGVEKNPNRSVVLYQKGCTDGSMKACTELGIIYETGNGATKNEAKAQELFEHACTNEFEVACARVAANFRKDCNGGKALACFQLGVIMENGRGVMKSEAQSATLYNKACTGGHLPACQAFGKLYEEGRGVPADKARALHMYHTACQGGHQSACAELQRLNQ